MLFIAYSLIICLLTFKLFTVLKGLDGKRSRISNNIGSSVLYSNLDLYTNLRFPYNFLNLHLNNHHSIESLFENHNPNNLISFYETTLARKKDVITITYHLFA